MVIIDSKPIEWSSVRFYAGTVVNVTNRRRLNAALAKTTSQSTFGNPRNLILRSHAMVFNQPEAGSIRGRAC